MLQAGKAKDSDVSSELRRRRRQNVSRGQQTDSVFCWLAIAAVVVVSMVQLLVCGSRFASLLFFWISTHRSDVTYTYIRGIPVPVLCTYVFDNQ